jgi:CRP-like cAMP-binding protein
MFFIAKGRFDVYVKKNHATAVGSGSNKSKVGRECSLAEGDHFGEIGLIYGCRRTATVESSNYGTLAMLTRTNFWEL